MKDCLSLLPPSKLENTSQSHYLALCTVLAMTFLVFQELRAPSEVTPVVASCGGLHDFLCHGVVGIRLGQDWPNHLWVPTRLTSFTKVQCIIFVQWKGLCIRVRGAVTVVL